MDIVQYNDTIETRGYSEKLVKYDLNNISNVYEKQMTNTYT